MTKILIAVFKKEQQISNRKSSKSQKSNRYESISKYWNEHASQSPCPTAELILTRFFFFKSSKSNNIRSLLLLAQLLWSVRGSYYFLLEKSSSCHRKSIYSYIFFRVTVRVLANIYIYTHITRNKSTQTYFFVHFWAGLLCTWAEKTEVVTDT